MREAEVKSFTSTLIERLVSSNSGTQEGGNGGSTWTAVVTVNVISIQDGPSGYAIIAVGTFEPGMVPTAAPMLLPATPAPTNPFPTPSPTMFLCNTDADCLQCDYANFLACTE